MAFGEGLDLRSIQPHFATFLFYRSITKLHINFAEFYHFPAFRGGCIAKHNAAGGRATDYDKLDSDKIKLASLYAKTG